MQPTSPPFQIFLWGGGDGEREREKGGDDIACLSDDMNLFMGYLSPSIHFSLHVRFDNNELDNYNFICLFA